MKLLDTYYWLRDEPRMCRRFVRKYGRTYTINVLGEPHPWTMTSDPEKVKRIFALKPEEFRVGVDSMGPLFGEKSLLMLNGTEHTEHKRVLAPLLRDAERYAPIMEDEARKALEKMPVGKTFAVRSAALEVTSNVILSTVFGAYGAQLRPLLADVSRWFDGGWVWLLVGMLSYRRKWWLRRLHRVLDPFDKAVLEIIALHRRVRHEDATILNAMLDAGWDDQTIRDECATLIFSGHDTAATAIAWTMSDLLRSPHYQRLARESGIYLRASVKESLRMHSVVPDVPRRPKDEIVGVCPARARASVNIHDMHRSVDHPDLYVPERWMKDGGPTAQWMPFGGGVRRCLGPSFATLEIEHVLRIWLQGAQFEAVGRPEKAVRRHITLVPKHGTRVKITRKEQ